MNQYDKFFGGERGAAAKARANMRKTYGAQGGDRVFWGTVTKRKRKTTGRRKPR